MSLSARQKKTVLRTLRISKELDDILEKDAKAHRTSVIVDSNTGRVYVKPTPGRSLSS